MLRGTQLTEAMITVAVWIPFVNQLTFQIPQLKEVGLEYALKVCHYQKRIWYGQVHSVLESENLDL